MTKEVKLSVTCDAGVNSSYQTKDAAEGEIKKCRHSVHTDAVMIKDVNENTFNHYDIYLTTAKTDSAFQPEIPLIGASPAPCRIPAMAQPAYDKIGEVVKKIKNE